MICVICFLLFFLLFWKYHKYYLPIFLSVKTWLVSMALNCDKPRSHMHANWIMLILVALYTVQRVFMALILEALIHWSANVHVSNGADRNPPRCM